MVKTLPLASGTLASDAASVVSVQSGSREVTREDFPCDVGAHARFVLRKMADEP